MFTSLQLPKLIFKTKSQYNGEIKVYETGDAYKLSVGGIVQSVSKNTKTVWKRVWGHIVNVLEEEKSDAKSILLLGLGGGTIPHLISEKNAGGEYNFSGIRSKK